MQFELYHYFAMGAVLIAVVFFAVRFYNKKPMDDIDNIKNLKQLQKAEDEGRISKEDAKIIRDAIVGKDNS